MFVCTTPVTIIGRRSFATIALHVAQFADGFVPMCAKGTFGNATAILLTLEVLAALTIVRSAARATAHNTGALRVTRIAVGARNVAILFNRTSGHALVARLEANTALTFRGCGP